MNLLQKIKVGLEINRAYDEMIKENKMNPAKPGWRTTEFWMTAATVGTTMIGAMQGIIPPQYATIGVAVLTAVYTICRTLSKTAATAPTDTSNVTVTSSSTSGAAPSVTVTK